MAFSRSCGTGAACAPPRPGAARRRRPARWRAPRARRRCRARPSARRDGDGAARRRARGRTSSAASSNSDEATRRTWPRAVDAQHDARRRSPAARRSAGDSAPTSRRRRARPRPCRAPPCTLRAAPDSRRRSPGPARARGGVIRPTATVGAAPAGRGAHAQSAAATANPSGESVGRGASVLLGWAIGYLTMGALTPALGATQRPSPSRSRKMGLVMASGVGGGCPARPRQHRLQRRVAAHDHHHVGVAVDAQIDARPCSAAAFVRRRNVDRLAAPRAVDEQLQPAHVDPRRGLDLDVELGAPARRRRQLAHAVAADGDADERSVGDQRLAPPLERAHQRLGVERRVGRAATGMQVRG